MPSISQRIAPVEENEIAIAWRILLLAVRKLPSHPTEAPAPEKKKDKHND